MAERLLLVRHARIAAHCRGKLIGASDVPLDHSGEIQACGLAARVARWSPQVCFSSPLRRCRQTASAAVPRLPVHLDADLSEINFGEWECRTFAEAAAGDPLLADRWAAFRPDFAFPGGESVDRFLRRVRAAADRLTRAEASTVLAVTHGGVMRAMMCYLLGLEPRHYVAFDAPYAAMAVIDLFGTRGVLAALERPDAAGDGHG